MLLRKSEKLREVCYDIRGPILREARRLEEEGYHIAKLNIGDPAQWGFAAPDEIIHDVILNLPHGQGYSESQGLFSARKAVMQRYQALGVPRIEIDDIFLGNGVSELIQIAVQGLLNDGDEVLVPAPDYPLWTAAVNLAGGTAVHYLCDEGADWMPDLMLDALRIPHPMQAQTKIKPPSLYANTSAVTARTINVIGRNQRRTICVVIYLIA